MAICSCFEILWSVETEWGQALFGLCNCLTLRELIGQSLQSIMGPTLTRRSISLISLGFYRWAFRKSRPVDDRQVTRIVPMEDRPRASRYPIGLPSIVMAAGCELPLGVDSQIRSTES